MHYREYAGPPGPAGDKPPVICLPGLTRNARRINAKSIMGVMMLAAGKGAKVTLEADGADEQECIAALAGLVNDKFGEGE